MKVTALIFCIFLSLTIFANDDSDLTVYQDGLTIEVANFEEGDKLKLFEVESGDHILSKSYSSIDLTNLPIGSYLLENNQGQSVIINRQEEELVIDGKVITMEEENFEIVENNEILEIVADQEEVMSFKNDYAVAGKNLLSIERDGDIIVVVDFEEGDKLKLFEVQDTVHILSKTTNEIDLSQLPLGVYMLENNRGDAVRIEKFTETQVTLTDI